MRKNRINENPDIHRDAAKNAEVIDAAQECDARDGE
jgi:hypothetical protein